LFHIKQAFLRYSLPEIQADAISITLPRLSATCKASLFSVFAQLVQRAPTAAIAAQGIDQLEAKFKEVLMFYYGPGSAERVGARPATKKRKAAAMTAGTEGSKRPK
jgi:hypothetical protein